MTQEVWKPIPGTNGDYEISSTGYYRRTTMGPGVRRLMEPRCGADTEDGYCRAHLRSDGHDWLPLVHRVVAQAFLEPVDGKLEINHKDGNKKNNDVSNLEWCTRSENTRHVRRVLGLDVGSKKQNAKLHESDIPVIRNLVSSGVMKAEVARMYGVHFMTIQLIFTGRNWSHVA